MMTRRPGSIAPVLLVAAIALGLAAGAVDAADIGALLDRARAAAGRSDHDRTIEALEEALAAVRAEAPLRVTGFGLVERPAKLYGDSTPRQDSVLRRGEPMQFYAEPKNLVYARMPDGTSEVAFKTDIRILGADGTVLFEQADFGSWRFVSRSRIQDIFMNLEVSLTGAPAGEYQVEFVLRDGNSPKTATVAQRVTLK
jgi:hypothetical protein